VTATRRGFLASLPVMAAAACGVAAVPGAPGPVSSQVPQPAPPSPAPSPAPDGPARELVHATSGRAEVALTFHGAGDPGLARSILTTLAERGAAVTVLAVGTWLAQYPDVAKLVTDHGHELGNHTWSHQQMPQLDAGQAAEEVARGAAALKAAVGSAGWWFRPSGTPHSTATIRAAALKSGYQRCVSYDVDSRDFTDPGPVAIRRALTTSRAGSVVSMHLGHPGTLTALPGVLDDLGHRGLTPVTASALFR